MGDRLYKSQRGIKSTLENERKQLIRFGKFPAVAFCNFRPFFKDFFT